MAMLHWVLTRSVYYSTLARYIFFRNHSTSSYQTLYNSLRPCKVMMKEPTHLLLPARTVISRTKLKLADNSENAKVAQRYKDPYCIKLPKNNKVGKFGDVIKIAHCGKTHNALIISNRKISKTLPRYDHNLIVLLNEKMEPVGTRILVPVPSALRQKEGQYSKLIAMATRFI